VKANALIENVARACPDVAREALMKQMEHDIALATWSQGVSLRAVNFLDNNLWRFADVLLTFKVVAKDHVFQPSAQIFVQKAR
jgi:hypothetical protein